MTEDVEGENKAGADFGRADFLMLVICVCLPKVLVAWESMNPAEATLVGCAAGAALRYWLPPRPNFTFTGWAVMWLVLSAFYYLAFFKVPALLEQRMPSMLAYGIPILMFSGLYILALMLMKPSASKRQG